MCRTALARSPEGKLLTAGFNQGILFLLIVPFLIFAVVAFLIYRAGRRHKAPSEEALL